MVGRLLVTADSATSSASTHANENELSALIIALSIGFTGCFWTTMCVMISCIRCSNNRALNHEVQQLQAQGHKVKLRDFQLRPGSTRKRKVTTTNRALEADDDDVDDGWDEYESKMTDKEEVIQRTWQWKALQALMSIPMIVFMSTVVVVDLIVSICAEVILTPSEAQSYQVDTFALVVIVFFILEVVLRMYSHYFVKSSILTFFRDTFNSIDFFVVLIDVACLIVITFVIDMATSYYSKTNGQIVYLRIFIRIPRVFRIVRIFALTRAERIASSSIISQSINVKINSKVKVKEIELVEIATADTTITKAVEMLEARILEDLVKRALRIEQPSWYHFNEAEKLKIEGVYNMFTVSRALHRADVMAALRRFGCKVNTSQARFLIHEFDHDGKGVFSLSQFTSICARAQVVAAYEPPAGSESADTNVKQRGLSMIEVRALVDVFDEIDSRKNKSRKASPGEHFLFSDFANDGLIDKQQLVMAIKNGGYNPTLGEMNDYMNTFDPQDSGFVSKQDFLIIMGRVPTAQGTFTTKQYAKIVQLFDMYDVDSQGLLTFQELKALMWRLDLNLRKGAAAIIVDRLFPTGPSTPLDKQTVVSILSHAKARRDQYVRGGAGITDSFSPVLDGAELGEDLSRVPKVPPGVFTLADRALVKKPFELFDASGSGTIPRYLFKKCVRMLGFYQIDSLNLDTVARKIPAHRDGRMDFPEFFVLVGFVMQNIKRGIYGNVIGTIFETPPDEPEAIEDALAVICDPTFLAQFSDSALLNLGKCLPVIAKYVDEKVPSASSLYRWMEESISRGRTQVSIDNFIESIHDAGEKYYSEFDERRRTFHLEQLFRWIGEDEARRAAEALAIYTDKSSVLQRTLLEQLLVDLGYPVASHESSKDVLKEFTHPKDKSTVLYPELLHCLKSLSVVRFKAENSRGDFMVDARGIVSTALSTSASINPLVPGEIYVAGDDAGIDNPTPGEKKRGAKGFKVPAGGYMLVPKNIAKSKMKKTKAKDELDEEGYVKPRAAYELFVLTNPTEDQVDMLFQWNNVMTDDEKAAFEREAKDMIKAYDDLKGGMVDKEQANDVLKRRDVTKIKRMASMDKKDAAQLFSVLPSFQQSKASASSAPIVTQDKAGNAGSTPASKTVDWDSNMLAQIGQTAIADVNAQSPGPAKMSLNVFSKSSAEPDFKVVEEQHTLNKGLASAPPPRAPVMGNNLMLSAAFQEISPEFQLPSVIIPPGLSASGVPAELTMSVSSIDQGRKAPIMLSHMMTQLPHISGSIANIAPPAPPSLSSSQFGMVKQNSGISPFSRSALSLPPPNGFGGPAGLPPPPPMSSFRR